jgi:hypothetical protein
LLFDKALRDRQSQSRAFIGGICVSLNLAEFLENGRMVLSSDTYPRIGDRYINVAPLFTAIDVDSAVLWRELDRVAQQVRDTLVITV